MVSLNDLEQYFEARFPLIRLKPNDKAPARRTWRQESITTPEAEEWIGNIGARITTNWLVLDVDPRNYQEGEDSFANLCQAIDCSFDACPAVDTSRPGGRHYYMRLGKKHNMVTTMPGYPGLDFKQEGGQVVAAGSTHPETGQLYAWVTRCPDGTPKPPLADAPFAPEALIRLLTRKNPNPGRDYGPHTPEEIATMLEGLDPEQFRDQQEWLNLMMACHHGSNGQARDEFVEWSMRDEMFAGQDEQVKRRWDSLSVDDERSHVTVRTLWKALYERDLAGLIPSGAMAASDFAGEPVDLPGDPPNLPTHEKGNVLGRMDSDYFPVMTGGKFVIFTKRYDPVFQKPVWVGLPVDELRKEFSNQRVRVKPTGSGDDESKEGKPKPLFDVWLKRRATKRYEFVTVDPDNDIPETGVNLWSGWSVEPLPGEWSYFKELIHEVLSSGNDAIAEYVIKWMAYLVQRPGVLPETALCFYSPAEGTGKSTFGSMLVRLAGPHGLHLVSARHLTGQFTHHLLGKVVVFSDEALSPKSDADKARLRGMVTEKFPLYEQKHHTPISGRNIMHVIMASNDEQLVSMNVGSRNRRYMVSQVDHRKANNHRFFGRLHRQMGEQEGLGAMLHDLLTMDLKNWHPRNDMPQTRGRMEQVLRSLSPLANWWFDCLYNGVVPGNMQIDVHGVKQDWQRERVRVFRQDVADTWRRHVERMKPGRGSFPDNTRAFNREWAALTDGGLKWERVTGTVPEERGDLDSIGSTNRAHAYELPSLPDARKAFDKLVEGDVDWPPLEVVAPEED